MKPAFPLLLLLLGSLAGCKEAMTSRGDYDPTEAGSVDQAMCLLGFTAVPLRELVTGHHLVEAEINGKAGTFILDTGANATVFHAPLAAGFGLGGGSVAPGAAIGLGGAMKARQVRIESFRIGGVPIRRSQIMTADLSQLATLLGRLGGGTIHGIIGQDVMKEHRAVIDVAKPILYLVGEDRDPAPVPAERCRTKASAKA
jgi:predicted aspartyl protease